ncbi:cyclic nucleotide-binding domain-containing protein [Synechococcus sp. CCY 0621]|uniref:cyclic nucleotide-binding domain-containing protein n=1 Tax=Synechococcus sp. CCY 0621 TaxID=2815603 RepID=UPI001C24090F|nr:cyclic nucleotide-binding domain-containing protein [Synechococcus sp. CCY 0621]
MQLFSRLPEQQLRRVRWALLIGWMLLIASLLLPVIMLPAALVPPCSVAFDPDCQLHQQPGNRLFWGTVVPVGLLLIGAISHELWRRVCPLAFVSQLARALGRQRSRPGRKGRPEVVMVEAESWLGRHHLTLQWSLLIGGLCLRLLAVNGSPIGLAILLLVTLAAALLVGWSWGGKAWCQYVCPMGPVQTVLTGLRGPLGSTAHVASTSKITQSMCRTLAAEGREQSACVACQVPCIDIDAERSFWQNLHGKRGLSWIWYSYPGLIVAFFLLMQAVGVGSGLEDHPLGYLRSGAWAFDAGQPQRVWQALWPALPLPRLLAVPLLLSAAAASSVLLFQGLQRLLERFFRHKGLGEPQERAAQRTRLLASFLAINLFFWFVDPFQGALGGEGGEVLQLLVLLATSIALYRSWGRDQATYRRESASESLRRQLRDLPGLEAALDGRSLEVLSPQEVFTLVKALPALGRQQGRGLYRDVMAEMLRTGRLDRASALLELQELRQTLQLDDSDHHAVVRTLASEQPELLELDPLQRQVDDLRREAAHEAVEELLRLAGLQVLEPERLSPALQEQLDHLQAESGLDEARWQAVLQSFGPRGELERRHLEERRVAWTQEAGLRALLGQLAAGDPLLRPLVQAMVQRTEGPRRELDRRLVAAGLEPLPASVPACGELDQALDLLWRDPDPDTAGWVLMLARERDPQRAARHLQDPRTGLAASPFLLSQRRGEIAPDREEFPAIAGAQLFADLLPEGILWVAHQGHLQACEPGETLMSRGAPSDGLALVLQGEVRLQTAAGQPVVIGVGQTVGEMGVITGDSRSASVAAGEEGATLFVLPSQVFEELLRRSRHFGRGLLAHLAARLEAEGPVLAN